MHFLGKVTVRFKKSVLEPQGQAVMLSLKESGHKGIDLVRVGKFIEVDVEADSESDARTALEKMANELLFNPVMEVCDIEVSQAT